MSGKSTETKEARRARQQAAYHAKIAAMSPRELAQYRAKRRAQFGAWYEDNREDVIYRVLARRAAKKAAKKKAR